VKIIRNAIVYKAELPAIDLLSGHLAEKPFEPIGESFINRAGFTPDKISGELITAINGGLSFLVRFDEKILPKASVEAAVSEAQKLAEEEGVELTKELKAQIKERVYGELVAKALVQTTYIRAFYFTADQFLIVNTTNKNHADLIISMLIQVVGSVKTQTIHIANIKGGLTVRLKNYIAGNREAFDGFKLGDSCLLKLESNKASFDLENLDHARAGINESLEKGMEVERLELVHGEMSFKLTKDFHLRGISFFGELTEDEQTEREELDGAEMWRTEAAVQLIQIAAAIRGLCDLLGYKEPADEKDENQAELDLEPADVN
jgi:recombination associated protein RdgC